MIDEMGYYVINEYDKKPPFSSFLAGIAGVTGKPLWTFFVNRGQGISSFGIRDKNGCIMEFQPANEAYKMVHINGFRTFVRLGEDKIYEPFAVRLDSQVSRTMKIKNNELRIEEVNTNLGLKFIVTYFTISNEPFASLARRVEIENLTEKEMNVQILDGMPDFLPYGTDLRSYKEMSNTLRSWMQAEVTTENIASYKLRASSEDTTEVKVIESVYYYKAFDDTEVELVPIIDPQAVFGYDTSYLRPIGLIEEKLHQPHTNESICYNKVPCAFSLTCRTLEGHGKAGIYSFMGYVSKSEDLDIIKCRLSTKDYFEKQLKLSNSLIDEVTVHVDTKTAYPLWDAYVKQCYVDNVLRGGYPIRLGKKSEQIYYIYSRKHGDLERDYNFFAIEPNYYSQGNANFRDVCQNRRLDTYLHPAVRDENIELFYDLLQLDGYNPLVISGKKFILRDLAVLKSIEDHFKLSKIERLEGLLGLEFTIGELFACIKDELQLGGDEAKALMHEIIDHSEATVKAEFGEGFWIDHWTYNLDMTEQFLEIYPDERKNFLLGERKYRYYNSPEYVLPRSEKYKLTQDGVRQYLSLKAKEEKIEGSWVCTARGDIYTTHLMCKLVTLALVKFAGLDPYGLGIEMEAGKPGWNDAMNGLPGILGSSTAEMFELKRLVKFIIQNLDLATDGLEVPVEFKEFIVGMEAALKLLYHQEMTEIDYWDTVSSLRERFRERTKYKLQGEEYCLDQPHMEQLFNLMMRKLDEGTEKLKALTETIVPTFLHYEVDQHTTIEDALGRKVIKPVHFKLHVLPEFLEGPVRYLKTGIAEEEKEKLYRAIKASDIYDKKLKMYKVSASIEAVSYEIGRSRVFTPGWLERESIFMHMSFKYLLELIKNGLYEAFFEEMKYSVPAFMNPEVYGRSLLENSSFIASSANPDCTLHGRGFIARLSGSTVEFLNMWKVMMTGHQLFSYENGELSFRLHPILKKDFFNEAGEIQTTLLGSIALTYKNTNKKDTFGTDAGKVVSMIINCKNGIEIKLEGDTANGHYAEMIRSGQVLAITAVIA